MRARKPDSLGEACQRRIDARAAARPRTKADDLADIFHAEMLKDRRLAAGTPWGMAEYVGDLEPTMDEARLAFGIATSRIWMEFGQP